MPYVTTEDSGRYPMAINYENGASWVRVFNSIEEEYVKSLKLTTAKGFDLDTWREQQKQKLESLPPKKEDYRTPEPPPDKEMEDIMDGIIKQPSAEAKIAPVSELKIKRR
jgi:hypothetical protein